MASDPARMQQANVHVVQPGYFEAMRSRIIEGRVFTEEDNNPDSRAIVIDDQLAAKAFPQGDAVGKRILARVRTPEPEWYDIIGVVAHQRHATYTSAGREAIFYSDGYMGFNRTPRWAVRTAGNPESVAKAVRAALTSIDARLLVTEMQPMTRMIAASTATTRFALTIITIFAAVAALLAAVGLYGVLSTVVRQRTAEIGVRMAFGAPRKSILQLIIGHGLVLSTIGIAVGLAGAVGLTRIMGTLLVGVGPTDPLTFGAIAVVFSLIAAAASWVPARRAAALEPTAALREE
jgi:putative ABC transport system permease protein